MPSPDTARLASLVAKAADLCLPPYRHAVKTSGADEGNWDDGEGCFRLEARHPDGSRHPEGDLDLEIYRSGGDLHLMLSRVCDAIAPMLWHGHHPVWMDAVSGQRCERPVWGAPLEALARRVRALVAGE